MPKVARILKDGNKMDYVATASVSNGDVVIVEDIVGVSHGDGRAGFKYISCVGSYSLFFIKILSSFLFKYISCKYISCVGSYG